MVLSFVPLVLNHSSAYTVFCLHGCFSKVSKNSISRGPPVLHLKGFQGSNYGEKVLITTEHQFSGKSCMFRILIFVQKILVVNKCFKTVKLVKKYFLIFHQLWRKREKRGENLFKAILIIRISHANIPLAYILPPSPSSSYLGPLYSIYIY